MVLDAPGRTWLTQMDWWRRAKAAAMKFQGIGASGPEDRLDEPGTDALAVTWE